MATISSPSVSHVGLQASSLSARLTTKRLTCWSMASIRMAAYLGLSHRYHRSKSPTTGGRTSNKNMLKKLESIGM